MRLSTILSRYFALSDAYHSVFQVCLCPQPVLKLSEGRYLTSVLIFVPRILTPWQAQVTSWVHLCSCCVCCIPYFLRGTRFSQASWLNSGATCTVIFPALFPQMKWPPLFFKNHCLSWGLFLLKEEKLASSVFSERQGLKWIQTGSVFRYTQTLSKILKYPPNSW